MSNTPFVSFLRSLMMMVMLITILLIAIFWNGLPSMKSDEKRLLISWKHFFQQDEEKPDREVRQETLTPTKSIPVDPVVPNDIPSEPERKIEEIKNQFEIVPLATPAAVEANLPEDFITIKKVLEQKYGATEVHLEPWGREGKMYRFSCYVSEPRGSGVKKLRQSIQATPALAVQKVLETMR